MNKTDRLLAIVLELQRNKVLRAEDLAATFETSVRTIYRDIQALSEAGVSVIGAPGQGYSLMEGYFLPPVSFTVEEAVALLIGTDFIEHWFDAYYGSKSRTSRGKIEAILPEPICSEASRIRKSFRLITTAKDVVRIQEKAFLEAIRRAILEERKIRFRYSKRIAEVDGNRQSVRTVAPYGLVLHQGSWVLIAWCELRQEIRHFRLSRMSELIDLEDRFMLPADFHLDVYQPPDDRNIRVRIQVQPDIADKVRESNNFYIETVEDHTEGLLVTFRVREPEELLHSVLAWGSSVVVLEPESFRHRVRDELEKTLKRY
ncbi:helix-turn-helix transcriptional regulator [Paenibacillus crassostreae]|uniref:Transcriptional regulator n=1 Tax=Paenibacillus crassostreae TaxID=1763538 RepID=A0A167DPJ3_9BACL|nr:YafY family protein [Paenibacillus crassostreae]AOZ91212.1 transcriptional regulator [Paenibacillus crassostreae]OAB74630.1 transcriptional regulator [Paenibacillus crassostreae]